MGARRVRAGLRGWGGVAAMATALACVLTAVLVLLPLTTSGGDGDDSAYGGGVTDATRAKADTCKPEASSLRPSPSDSGPVVSAIREKKRLVIGVDQNSYNWGYRDPNKPGGSLSGFDIDLAQAIADQILPAGGTVQFRAIPTNQRIPALQSGQVDMIVRTMTINCDRLKQVDFSTAYFKTGQQVLAPRTSDITGYNASLKGRKVCSAAGSTAETELKKESFGADISTTVPNQLDCLVRLQLGEVDAVVTDSALAAGQAAQDPTVEIKGDTFTTEYYGVAMKKGSDDLVRRVNQVLVDYRKQRWQVSYDEWLADDLGKTSGPPAPQYRD
ncbi:glutamate ABC transporter substrate-binding protein [Streptomyces sp. NPDC091292]|uniref:glutamate ABC transporter substrate-binding protein n=1 Tax=Streptomyces sp. NPDC091292 TaxID=3365991 RepID=UPI0037FC2A10